MAHEWDNMLASLPTAYRKDAWVIALLSAIAGVDDAQRADAEALGEETAPLDRLSDILPGADAVLNTIPALVVDGETAARIPPEALVYELASAPGGFTPEALRIRAVKPALSLPGKYAPLSCARWMERLILQENLKEGFV